MTILICKTTLLSNFVLFFFSAAINATLTEADQEKVIGIYKCLDNANLLQRQPYQIPLTREDIDHEKKIFLIKTECNKPQIKSNSHMAQPEGKIQEEPGGTCDRIERIRIRNPSLWPYNIHVHIVSYFKANDGRKVTSHGNGILIGSNQIGTVGHNIYRHTYERMTSKGLILDNIDDWAFEIEVYFYHALGKKIKVSTAMCFEKWIKQQDRNYDLGILTLTETVGVDKGWAGLCCASDSYLEIIKNQKEGIRVSGASSDKDSKYEQLWTMNGNLLGIDMHLLYHNNNTGQGSSGSAMCLERLRDGQMTYDVNVIGFQAYSYIKKEQGNQGIRLSQDKFDLLMKWMQWNPEDQKYFYSDDLQNHDQNIYNIEDENQKLLNHHQNNVLAKAKQKDISYRDSVKWLAEYFWNLKDDEESKEWYTKLRDYNSKEKNKDYYLANCRIGTCYYRDHGVPRDIMTSLLYYKLSGNNEETPFYLNLISQDLSLEDNEKQQARQLFEELKGK